MGEERDTGSGGDLFDRWLAHREEHADAAPRPRTYAVPRTGARAVPTPGDEEAVPEEPLTEEPLIQEPPAEESVAPGTPVQEVEQVADDPAPVATPEPVGLADFEPVLLASVRRAQAAAEPQPRPEPEPDPEPEPEPEPEREPEQPPARSGTEAWAEVVAAVRTEPDPAPETPAREPRDRPARVRRPRAPLSAYVDAARTTLDRSVRGLPEERTEPVRPLEPEPASTGEPQAPERDPALSRSAYDELRAEREAAAPPPPERMPPDVDFPPRTLARRATTLLLLLGLAATALAAWHAYDTRVQTDIGLAAILALFSGIVWAVRAGTVPTRVGLHGGRLEVRAQAGRFVFEIGSPHTRLESVGSPGRRGWRLLVHRRGLAPFPITGAMVDPDALLEALRYYRPDL